MAVDRANVPSSGRLTFVSPHVGQFLKPATFENRLELGQECVVQQTIRSQRFPAGDLERAAAEIADPASGLFHQQNSGGSVPWVQVELPIGLKPSRRNRCQVDRRGSCAPHTMCSQRDLMIEKDIWVLV